MSILLLTALLVIAHLFDIGESRDANIFIDGTPTMPPLGNFVTEFVVSGDVCDVDLRIVVQEGSAKVVNASILPTENVGDCIEHGECFVYPMFSVVDINNITIIEPGITFTTIYNAFVMINPSSEYSLSVYYSLTITYRTTFWERYGLWIILSTTGCLSAIVIVIAIICRRRRRVRDRILL